ncbi:hypothetical protein C8R47DRAFT_1084965 [Mycena vitilis]|nr:hypothetical protein C8R47DRAFT_1084965 [Mycena vitilis]
MTFTNIGVCPYLSPLVLVSSVGLAKQRAEATAFPMVRRPSAEGIAQSSPGCVGVETETHFAHAERDRKPSMRSAEQREKAQKSGQGITQRVRRGPAITDDTFHNIANPGLGACVPSCHYIPALFVTTSDDNRLATALFLVEKGILAQVVLDTGRGYTRGFVPEGMHGYGYGSRNQTRTRPVYPTRVPAGFEGSEIASGQSQKWVRTQYELNQN